MYHVEGFLLETEDEADITSPGWQSAFAVSGTRPCRARLRLPGDGAVGAALPNRRSPNCGGLGRSGCANAGLAAVDGTGTPDAATAALPPFPLQALHESLLEVDAVFDDCRRFGIVRSMLNADDINLRLSSIAQRMTMALGLIPIQKAKVTHPRLVRQGGVTGAHSGGF